MIFCVRVSTTSICIVLFISSPLFGQCTVTLVWHDWGGGGEFWDYKLCLLWDRTWKCNSFAYIIVGLLPESAMLWDRTKRPINSFFVIFWFPKDKVDTYTTVSIPMFTPRMCNAVGPHKEAYKFTFVIFWFLKDKVDTYTTVSIPMFTPRMCNAVGPHKEA